MRSTFWCALALVTVAVVGCRAKSSVQARAVDGERAPPHGPDLRTLYPLAKHSTWSDEEDEKGKQRTLHWDSRCTELPPFADGEVVTECVEQNVEGLEDTVTRRLAYRREGLVVLSSASGAHLRVFDPPRLLIPVDPRPGTRWRHDREVDGVALREEYEVLPPESCEGSVVIAMTYTFEWGAVEKVTMKYCAHRGEVAEIIDVTKGAEHIIRSVHHDFRELP
jgi:hypothetical protein